jgi:O-methyltransferase
MSTVTISQAAAVQESSQSRPSAVKLVLNWIIYRLRIFTPLIRYTLHQSQFVLMSWYRSPADMKLLRTIYRERRPLLQPLESFNILALARAQSQLDGDMAEVGVYQGSSARMICTEKGTHHFWGFDTFSGLADVGEQDTHNGVRFFRAGHFAADYETTSAYLKEFDNVQLVKGFFPESAECIADRRFSFVHLDVDTYGSTLASMRYFWPRLVDRGIIITHDGHSDGVARAIAEFTAETGARAISSACSQMILTR